MDATSKLCHPWCERNKQPILEVLERVLPGSGLVLEIGSGSGQHAAFFALHLGSLRWQPSDIDGANLESIRAWSDESGLPNLLEPVRLDVQSEDWPVSEVTAVFSACMIHIAPWECCIALAAGARRHVEKGGLFLLYGPFRIAGRHTSDSNRQFDESLRARDPRWGVRDLDRICEASPGFKLEECVEMPANNHLLVLRRVADST